MFRHHLIVSLLLTCCSSFILADSAAEDKNDFLKKAMRARIAKVKAKFADEESDLRPLVLHDTALLSPSDPTRSEIDGNVWLWRSDQVPVALLSLTYTGKRWIYEHVSLTGRALEFTGEKNWKWTPKERQLKWFKLEEPVAQKTNIRKIQLRAALRQLEAEEFWGENYNLRLLPRPLYLYSSADRSILEGGLFAFAHGTNPEVIVRIEAREDDMGKLAWHVSFSRLANAELTVKYKDEVIWEVPRYKSEGPDGSYYTHGTLPTEAELVD